MRRLNGLTNLLNILKTRPLGQSHNVQQKIFQRRLLVRSQTFSQNIQNETAQVVSFSLVHPKHVQIKE